MLSTCYIRLRGLVNKTDTFPAFWGSQSLEEADSKPTRFNECVQSMTRTVGITNVS